MNLRMIWQELTPSQRLWLEVFGLSGLPKLDEKVVIAIIDTLPSRQRAVVRLRFGFDGTALSLKEIGKRLIRADSGKMGVSKEITRLELKKAIRHLRHPSRRKLWQEAKS